MCAKAGLAESGSREAALGGTGAPARYVCWYCLSSGLGVDGVLGKCTKTEVYPRPVRSKLATEGVECVCVCVCVRVGVSMRWMNDPEGARLCEMESEGRRVGLVPVMEGRRGKEEVVVVDVTEGRR